MNKRLLVYGIVLALGLVGLTPAAFAQADDDEAALNGVVETLLDATVHFNQANLESVIAEDAVVIVSQYGTEVLDRAGFLKLAKTEDLSMLTFPEREIEIWGSLGFVKTSLVVPGFANGFLYGVFGKGEDGWKLRYAAVDPYAEMMSATKKEGLTKVADSFIAELVKAVKANNLRPL